MTYQIILDDEWATVRYHPTDRYIYHTFHQPVGGQIMERVLNTGLEHLKKNGAVKWLSDDRNNAELKPADIEFGVKDWGPRAAAAGWKFWALIVPESFAGRASMQDIVEIYWSFGVRVGIFTDLDKAREWLVKM